MRARRILERCGGEEDFHDARSNEERFNMVIGDVAQLVLREMMVRPLEQGSSRANLIRRSFFIVRPIPPGRLKKKQSRLANHSFWYDMLILHEASP